MGWLWVGLRVEMKKNKGERRTEANIGATKKIKMELMGFHDIMTEEWRN